MPRFETPRLVQGASTALSTTPAIIGLVHVPADSSSTGFPAVAHLGKFCVRLTSIAGGATEITWYLSADSAGDVPITPSHTATITTGQTAGKGGICVLLDAASAIPDDYYTEDTVYCVLDLDAGTATGVPWLEFWK